MKGDGRIYRQARSEHYYISVPRPGRKPVREVARDRRGNPTSDPNEAEKWLRRRKAEVSAETLGGRQFETAAMHKLTIHDLLERKKARYQEQGQDSPQNLCVLARADRDFGHILALAADSTTFSNYRASRPNDARATVNRVLQCVRAAYRLAFGRREIAHVPHIEILSEEGNARQGFFESAQLEKVIAHLPADLRDLTRFASITGMRKGELCSLRWSDVDGDTLKLAAENSKNGEARILPLVGEVGAIISRRRSARRVERDGVICASEFVFHRDSDPGPVGEFRKAWKHACKLSGVSGRIFHDLRRTAVRGLIRKGVDQVTAMKISGHKTTDMFRRYSIVSTADIAAALEKVAAAK